MARINTLNTLAGKDWGQRSENLKSIYNQYVQPVADYALGAWGPYACKTNIERIQRAENRAARVITGCPRLLRS